MPRNEARLFAYALTEFCTAGYDFEVTQRAWQIQDRHGFSWWDCVLLASASHAGCDLFLSEDLQHNRRVDGLTILDPFKLDADFQLSR
jgi:predicted nucleic acid-binding protein